jgi:hypothetical protein
MGKNFSANNVTGKRRVADSYETPYSLTSLFLDTGFLNPAQPVLEPACGNGAITRVLEDYGFAEVESYDLAEGTDFLNETLPVAQIITNPPYSLAYEFIQHAKKIATERFCFLLPLSYLHGKKRFDNIWKDKEYALKSVYVFTRYPMLGEPLREDGKFHTGMIVYSWMCWERAWYGKPTIDWLDNNSYILTKAD